MGGSLSGVPLSCTHLCWGCGSHIQALNTSFLIIPPCPAALGSRPALSPGHGLMPPDTWLGPILCVTSPWHHLLGTPPHLAQVT